jgi:Domain of unknown function (DUF4126)
MSLFMDIGTGAGLAGATGVRPFLPPLLAGALARGDVGIDFDGTDWSFLESPAFLAAVLVVGLVAYGAERSRAAGAEAERSPLDVALLALAAILGALLFAGALADGGHGVAIGLVAGPLCAVLGGLAVGGLAQRARRRLDPAAAGLLTVYADTAALVLAAVAVFVPPLSFVALIGFAVLLLSSRRREGEKYAGLRVLR